MGDFGRAILLLSLCSHLFVTSSERDGRGGGGYLW